MFFECLVFCIERDGDAVLLAIALWTVKHLVFVVDQFNDKRQMKILDRKTIIREVEVIQTPKFVIKSEKGGFC